MRVVTWVPWRPDNGPRSRIYEVIRHCIDDYGFEVIEADSGHKPFSVANTWNLCAELSGDWDVALLHAADLYVPVEQAYAALDLVKSGEKGMTYCHDRHIKLTPKGTSKFMLGHRDGWLDEDFNVAKSMTAGPRFITRDLWEAVGGFDPRFIGWGYEDNHFKQKAGNYAPHARVQGDMLNMWHPKAKERPTDPYWKSRRANKKLWQSLQD